MRRNSNDPLPENWDYRAIGGDIDLLTGPAFDSTQFTDDVGVRLARGINVTKGKFRWQNGLTKCWPKVTRSLTRYLLSEGDIVIGMDGSLVGRNFATVRATDLPALLVQRVARLRTSANLTNAFLYHWIASEFWLTHVDLVKTHSGIPHISNGDIRDFRINFPPKSEQSKIAQVLSTVDRAIEQTEALIAKQQRIKTGLMQDLLTRGIDQQGNLRSEQTHEFKDSPLGRIPKEWQTKPIEAMLDRIIDYRGRTPTKVPAGVPLLTAKNVRDGFIDEEPREYIADQAFDSWMTRGIPSCGDVLFTTEAPMGNVARVPGYKVALAQRVLTLCPKPDELSQDYLFWMLHWRRTTERLELLTSGSTVTGVKQSVFRKVVFRFPDLDEQDRITSTMNAQSATSQVQSSELKKLKSIKTALMQDLLTGNTRVTKLLPNQLDAVSSGNTSNE